MKSALLLNFASCLMMCGLIWLVQLVHYPAFKYVTYSSFQKFCSFHSRTITIIVMPLMFIELGTGFYLYYLKQNQFFLINLILIVLIWLSTFFLSVPLHEQLAKGFDIDTINKLVNTNWPRTFLWSTRSILLFFYIKELIKDHL